MFQKSTRSLAVRALAVTAVVALTFGISVPDAAAQNCYRVVNAKHLNVRTGPFWSGTVVTTVKGGRIVRKSGLPVCGLWWCKISTGKHVGYAGTQYLRKVACP